MSSPIPTGIIARIERAQQETERACAELDGHARDLMMEGKGADIDALASAQLVKARVQQARSALQQAGSALESALREAGAS